MILEDVAKLFYFMTFIPKFHILAPRSKKSRNFIIFGQISAILEDFLTEKETSSAQLKIGLGKVFVER